MAELVVGGVYEHYKRGNNYKVLVLARDAGSLEELVVYQGLYDSKEFGRKPVWVRPSSEFLEEVELDGKKVARFKLASR